MIQKLIFSGFLILSTITLYFFLFSDTPILETNVKNILEEKLYPYEGFHMSKQFPNKSFPYKSYLQNLANLSRNSATKKTNGQWEVQGPGNLGARINCIALHPTNANIRYIGFSHGGIFKTIDNGASWSPIFDDQAYLSISEITIDPSDPDILYVGTGDHNISGYPFIGDGIYKSYDAGLTWENIGLNATRIISRIEVSASNPDIIYAATMGLPFERNNNRGLYKSTNSGTSWDQILFVNDSTGIIDLLVHPQNPNTIYAAAWNRIRNNKESVIQGLDAKIHKSVDGGTSWTILDGGLPNERMSRIGLAMSEQDPNKIYALYVGTDFQVHSILRSFDGGENWVELLYPFDFGNILGGFGWYFGQIRVHPQNEDQIYILGVDMISTSDNGFSWQETVPPWFTYEVHADKHDLTFDNNGNMFLATDGGLYRSKDSGENWTDDENIPATQFYRVAYNPHEPSRYYGGAQDNGSTGGNQININEWDRIFGGDGFQMIFHPFDDQLVYAETQNGVIYYSQDGGFIFDYAAFGILGDTHWDAPYIMSKHNPSIMYFGADTVYKNIDAYNPQWIPISPNLSDPNSPTRDKVISCLDESSLDAQKLIAGTTDGFIWVTEDGGSNWKEVSTGVRKSFISDVNMSQLDANTLYATVTAYKDNDDSPYIYKSTDFGDSWTSIQANLPNLAINEMMILDGYEDRVLLVATDGGVYLTQNYGASWNRLGENMPIIPVYDLVHNPVKNEVVAGTFSRGIQSFDLRQIDLDGSDIVDLINGSNTIQVHYDGDHIQIKISSNINVSSIIEIYSLSGQKIYEQALVSAKDIYSIPKPNNTGLYIVSLSNLGAIISKKVFID